MLSLNKKRSDMDIARRQESKAFNELEFCECQVKEQASQLETLLQYRNECRDGLKTAKDTGLTPVHVREYQLLVKHINSVVEVVQHKVDLCQEKHEKAKQIWQEKNEVFVKIKDMKLKNAKSNVMLNMEKNEKKKLVLNEYNNYNKY